MTSLSLLLGRARQQLAHKSDLPKPLRLFVSMSDGQTRAHTVNSLGDDLESAWTGAAQEAQRLRPALRPPCAQAHAAQQRTAGAVLHLADLFLGAAEQHPGRTRDFGQFFRPDHDQCYRTDHGKLAKADIKHD